MYDTTVETRFGKLKGRAENGVRIFKEGVPYDKTSRRRPKVSVTAANGGLGR